MRAINKYAFLVEGLFLGNKLWVADMKFRNMDDRAFSNQIKWQNGYITQGHAWHFITIGFCPKYYIILRRQTFLKRFRSGWKEKDDNCEGKIIELSRKEKGRKITGKLFCIIIPFSSVNEFESMDDNYKELQKKKKKEEILEACRLGSRG